MTPYRLHASLGYNLSLAARIQERRLDEALRTFGLTRTTWCVLLAVGIEHHRNPSDIALFIGIDRTATSRALRHMETDGLLTRKTGRGDRRTTEVELTDLGVQRIGQCTPFAVQNNALMREKLTDEEHAQLLSLLGKLTKGETAQLSVF